MNTLSISSRGFLTMLPSADMSQAAAVLEEVDPTVRIWADVAWPWSDNLYAYFNAKSDQYVIDTAIRLILGTAKGERVMLPEFGSLLETVLFDPGTPGVYARLRHFAQMAVGQWESRIDLKDVYVSSDGEVATVTVAYGIKTIDPTKVFTTSFSMRLT